MNLNDHMRVTLTEHGVKVWRDYHERLGITPSPDIKIVMPLWELMFTFGPKLEPGSFMSPFLNNEIELYWDRQ